MKKTIAVILAAVLLLAVLPRAEATQSFSDVPADAWYAEAVGWAVEHGVTSGIGDGLFGPELPVNRAQAVTMLWRIASSPEPANAPQFLDVPSGQWYSKAIAWASENGVVSGYPGGYFAPGRLISRQELATMLFSFARYRDSSLTAPNTDLSAYTDLNQVYAYALGPMRWAVAKGIISGTSPTTLSPLSTATRAQLVQMLYKWLTSPGSGGWELPFIPKP